MIKPQAVLTALYNVRIWIRLCVSIWLLLAVAWTGMVIWAWNEQKNQAAVQAEEFAASLHELTLAGLTGMMVTGVIDQRNVFLDQIRSLSNVRSLKVIRGDSVSAQFGTGDPAETATEPAERHVLGTGETVFESNERDSRLRAILPIKAAADYLGKNCLLCHNVPAGTVLGAVSMELDLASINGRAAGFALGLFGVSVLLSLPVLLFIYVFIRLFVTAPLQEMTTGLRDIADGSGDLTKRLPVKGRDEIGQAADAFNGVMAKFQPLVAGLVQAAGRITSAIGRVTAAVDTVAADVGHQQIETQQVATAMNEMAATLQEVAGNAAAAASAAQHVSQQADEGKSLVSAATASIDGLAGEITGATEQIGRLRRETEAIQAVVSVIRTVADQTNLLALNAAIEAARAGASGRGFAVVAEEVRGLANHTHRSTEEIRRTVEGLLQAAELADERMQAGQRRAGSTVGQAQQADQALRAIDQAIRAVTDGNDQIAAATEQQRAVAAEIECNLEHIRTAADHSAEQAAQARDACAAIAALADELRASAGQFRTE